MVKEVDLNGDGYIDFEEFEQLMKVFIVKDSVKNDQDS
jgi:hypothetical protein